MARTSSLLLVLAVLAGSAAAFAISEGLKVERAAITATKVDKIFSPVCGCPTRRATVAFKLTRSDRVTLTMIDSRGRPVRKLVGDRLFNRGLHHFTWNGRDDRGRLVAEASYRPSVHLDEAARTYVLPNPIRVDVTPPRIRVLTVSPRSFSPGGRPNAVRVSYRLSEPAHAVLYVNGKRRVYGRFERIRDKLVWYGRVGSRALPPGRYRLSLAAVDLAGNQSRAVGVGVVQLVRKA